MNIKNHEPVNNKKKEHVMKRLLIIAGVATFLSIGLLAGYAAAGDEGTKEEAVAMVKKAIEYIKANGNEKAFEEISNPKGKFVDRDLYVVVYDLSAKCLAHGQKKNMVGKELIDMKDTDGKEYMKERVELMKKQTTAWQDYKFMNPVSKQIEPKSMYLERSGDLIVGCGIYKK
jgi:cytochrome c